MMRMCWDLDFSRMLGAVLWWRSKLGMDYYFEETGPECFLKD